jgi:hypothetical protein
MEMFVGQVVNNAFFDNDNNRYSISASDRSDYLRVWQTMAMIVGMGKIVQSG